MSEIESPVIDENFPAWNASADCSEEATLGALWIVNSKVESPLFPLSVSITVTLELPEASSKFPVKEIFDKAFFNSVKE